MSNNTRPASPTSANEATPTPGTRTSPTARGSGARSARAATAQWPMQSTAGSSTSSRSAAATTSLPTGSRSGTPRRRVAPGPRARPRVLHLAQLRTEDPAPRHPPHRRHPPAGPDADRLERPLRQAPRHHHAAAGNQSQAPARDRRANDAAPRCTPHRSRDRRRAPTRGPRDSRRAHPSRRRRDHPPPEEQPP